MPGFHHETEPCTQCYEYNKLLKGDDEKILLSLFISRTKQSQPSRGKWGIFLGGDVVGKLSRPRGIATYITKNSNFFPRTWSWIIQQPSNGIRYLMQVIVSRMNLMIEESFKIHSNQKFKMKTVVL